GGNRCENVRHYFNLIVAMTLCGLWHGASLNFILWGFYHGLLLIFFPVFLVRAKFLINILEGFGINFKIIITLLLTSYGWLLFRIQDFNYLLQLHKIIFDIANWGVGVHDAWAITKQLTIYILPLIMYETWQYMNGDTEAITEKKWFVQLSSYLILLLILIAFGEERQSEFIYFQF
ncbi:MAG: hypothetical protein K8S18_11655, partial [Desulfobacula sp.]|nr:hypothetical protein [Desulfobacula sp.]